VGASRQAVVAFALCLAAAGQPAAAAIVSLEPDRDNAMSQDDPAYANGAGSFLFIGAIASGGARRSMLRFDLTSIPAGSTVTAASLRFTISKTAPQSGFDPATLHRLVADWGEGTSNGGSGGGLTQASPGDATWDHRFYGDPPAVPRVFWAQPGADFVATASGGTTVGGNGTYTIPSTPQLVADVQAWVNQPASNFGWIMLGNETDSQSARRVFGRSAFAPAERPLLTIEYAPPGGGLPGHQVPLPAGALAVLAAVLGAIGAHARARQTGRRGKRP
jgi:hypothetical protein